jgi:hypothetical protein
VRTDQNVAGCVWVVDGVAVVAAVVAGVVAAVVAAVVARELIICS